MVMTSTEIRTVCLDEMRDANSITGTVFTRKVIDCKFHRSGASRRSDTNWDDVMKQLTDEIFVTLHDERHKCAVFSSDGAICKLLRYSTEGYFWYAASDDQDKLLAFEKRLKRALPIVEIVDDRLPLTFWALGLHGPRNHTRKIVVPSWKDIEENYPGGVGTSLSEIMKLSNGKDRGQLIMFHGDPGTGKSFAIRALLSEWRHWCLGEYIVDPEKFFGSSAEYMISVLLGNEDDDENGSTDMRWRVYIVEDGDEFLTGDAKLRSGQALSRLLNVVDGMIGQGLRVIVLVTTNEPLETIHPAVLRPGRCLANIQFRKFDKVEAAQWLNRNGNEPISIDDELTLADLYHKRGDVKSIQQKTKVRRAGFVQ
jgi:hypothetical protein